MNGIIKLFGTIENGKTSDIDFKKIERVIKERGAYTLLKTTNRLYTQELEIKTDALNSEQLENKIISNFEGSNPSRSNPLIYPLMRILQTEKLEDETSSTFHERLLSECKRAIQE